MASGKASDNCEYSIRPPAARLRQGAATPGRSLASGGRPRRGPTTGSAGAAPCGDRRGPVASHSRRIITAARGEEPHQGWRKWPRVRKRAGPWRWVARRPPSARAERLSVLLVVLPRGTAAGRWRAGWPARIGNLRRGEERHKARRPCGVCNGCGRALRGSASADQRIDG